MKLLFNIELCNKWGIRYPTAFLCHSCISTAKMTLFTGGRCGCTTAEAVHEALQEVFAHSIHGIDHLIQRDELGDTGQ